MKVLITGGAGFIGSHLSDSRFAMGDEVIILDNFSTGSSNNIEHFGSLIKKVSGDIRDQELVNSLVSEVDLVLHMAAAVGVKTILSNPIESINSNFVGSEVVLNACTKFEKKIVIASTSEIYGKNNKQPLTETDDRVMGTPQKLRWSYADSKALEESMAHALYLTKGLKVITIRFFNVVGPRQLGIYGMVLPRFIEAALHGKPLEVYGDGSQQRVFCHVLDAVSAVNGLLKEPNAIGQVFNIGGLEEISILDLANFVVSVLNSKSKIILKSYDDAYSLGFEDMHRRVPDLSKIKKFISWSPQINLDKIVRDIALSLI